MSAKGLKNILNDSLIQQATLLPTGHLYVPAKDLGCNMDRIALAVTFDCFIVIDCWWQSLPPRDRIRNC